MSGVIQTVLTVGGLSSFGRFVDALVQSKKGQALIATWWDRFDEIEPEMFAQREADFAVRFIDRVFGSRIFSRERQRFLAIILAFSLCVGIVIAFGREAFSWQKHVNESTLEMIGAFNRSSAVFVACGMLLSLFLLSLSLSITRWFAAVTAKLPSYKPWTSIAIFVAFLLFQFWIVVVGAFAASFSLVVLVHLVQLYMTVSAEQSESAVYSLASGLNFIGATVYGVMTTLYVSFVYAPLHEVFNLPFQLPLFLVMFQFPGDSLLENSLAISTAFLGYAGALIRLSIAAMFVASYASVPYKHQILHWLTELTGTKEPVFAISFGLLGALIVLAQALFSLFY